MAVFFIAFIAFRSREDVLFCFSLGILWGHLFRPRSMQGLGLSGVISFLLVDSQLSSVSLPKVVCDTACSCLPIFFYVSHANSNKNRDRSDAENRTNIVS